jgi:cell division protein FtsL
MIKLLHLLAIVGLLGSAGYAYSIKYEATYHAEQAAKLRHQIKRERDAIAVLRAEWALLNRPDRLQEAADRHLDLQSVSPHQLARFSDLPARAPKTDEIGRKLEALGLLEPTATPSDRRVGDARTPSTRTPSR